MCTLAHLLQQSACSTVATYMLGFIVKNEHFMFVAVSDETFHRIFLFHRLKHCFAKLLGSTHMHLID